MKGLLPRGAWGFVVHLVKIQRKKDASALGNSGLGHVGCCCWTDLVLDLLARTS